MRKRPRIKDPEHLKWIASLPCIITGRRNGVHAAHIRFGALSLGKRPTGMGEKPDDRWTVPLSADLHIGGKDSQHAMGERKWWLKQGINPLPIALALYGVSGDDEMGEYILFYARTCKE